jgi:hypothetical protein
LLQQRPWWAEWEPATGRFKFDLGKPPQKVSLVAVRDATNEDRRHFFMIEEKNDGFWEVQQHRKAPPHHIYTAWVEWFYRNGALYSHNYPIPIDTAWYEKRKYWAARQAEILEGFFLFSSF